MEESELPDKAGNGRRETTSVSHAMIRGGIGFGFVSVLAFSIWAFGGKWFQTHAGEGGLYGACTLIFVALSGLFLHPLVPGPRSLLHFYTIFIPAFLGYSIVWCIAWVMLRFGVGEWLGSFFGSAAFVGILSWRMRSTRGFLQASLVVFALNSAGYFLGGKLMHWILGPGGSAWFTGFSKSGQLVAAELAWGLLYGLGLGAGIGYAFHVVQNSAMEPNG